MGQILRTTRLQQELSQQDLADEAGVSVSMISKMELDWTRPSLITLVKLSAVLGTHVMVDVIRQVQKEVNG